MGERSSKLHQISELTGKKVETVPELRKFLGGLLPYDLLAGKVDLKRLDAIIKYLNTGATK